VNERSQVFAATVIGSVLGAIAGYLFFTEPGRQFRHRIEPAVDDLARELLNFKGSVARARGFAHEGLRLMDELATDAPREARPF